jgi:DNA (cytosine-5)-methyltransferase 1
LFTGYGGLDLGVLAALGGGRIVWSADDDRHVRTLLGVRLPGVPNLGDVQQIDWGSLEPVDVLTAGWPCQDISAAGKRAGITKGIRSGLFREIIRALRHLPRPPGLVVLENVAALRWKNGGLSHVLGQLAEAGFDAVWRSVRASDIGACHRRERIFIAAWPRRNPSPIAHRKSARGGAIIANTYCARRQRVTQAAQLQGLPNACVGSAHPAPDNYSRDRASAVDWREYSTAIRRWERVLGRHAPHPTQRGRHGKPVLAPRFVEWMLGLDAGHVTDLDIPRTAQLRILGNGVVPHQATHAVDLLLSDLAALTSTRDSLDEAQARHDNPESWSRPAA